MQLSTITGIIADMDGVLWRGSQPLPGLADFFDFLRAGGIPFVLATNNSSQTPQAYLHKLSGMGVNGLAENQIITSGTATADYLQTAYPPGTPVHVLGGDGLKQIIRQAGFPPGQDEARVVVAGVDFDLTYAKLKHACALVRAGADFIGTNADATFPLPDGLAPGAGSILAALATATGRQPTIIGKPGAPMFQTALRRLGTAPENTLMIGDRLNTDIEGARRTGLKTALLLTGVTTREELAASPIQPDGVYDGLPDLVAAWQRALAGH
ncbi:MAG: HAD-IIA family hydrolase [Chloroflexi bacterium]|nr:HAD-IIA family hydrolase [Chloroflexota bacterium]MDL1882419.1 HAD-IIA family hydrolase [Anaerolineae bacterium CFX8]